MKRYVSEMYSDLFSVYQKDQDASICEGLRRVKEMWDRCFITDYEAVKLFIQVCEHEVWKDQESFTTRMSEKP